MRIILLCLVALPLSIFCQQPAEQFSMRKATEKDIISCPHIGHEHSATSLNLRPILNERKRTKNKDVMFIPEYFDVPRTYQNTVEFVLDQLSDFVSTDVPIYVSVTYADLGGRGVGGLILANASAGSYTSNFPGAEYVNTSYPIALAEKLSGTDLNSPGQADIIINVNSNRDANFSVSPNSPVIGNKVDLATTLIHEIIHGLGFIGGVNVGAEGRGFISSTIYGRFLEDRDGVNYIDGYPNNSEDLGDEFTSNMVYFNGPRFGSETRAKVHAPSRFLPSSSISHLDLNTYQPTESRLMTPTAVAGDIIYDPGIAIDMLHDMGWFTTNFIHNQEEFFNEDATQDYTIRTKVRTDSKIDESTVKLHYSRDTFQNEDIIVNLPKDQATEEFFFALPATNTFTVYQYYFEVLDDSLGMITNPVRAPLTYYQYIMGEDTEGPQITGHIPVTSIRETDQQFTLTVNDVTDFFTGVITSSLAAVIKLNGELDTVAFDLMMDDFGQFYQLEYNNEFDAADELSYKIIALDQSIRKNEGQIPEEGFYTIEIEDVAAAVVSYVNNFNQISSDFTGTGFEIIQPEGFASAAIHSEHPYQNAGMGTLDFTYELSQLIVIDSVNPIIKFDEIVIVEKGDPGTSCDGTDCTFGSWDYVVVEAKGKNDLEWKPLLDAYDSRVRSVWLTAYDNGEEGRPELYKSRTIDLTKNSYFNIGDEVFIRFRLFSDPLTIGWGWAIDNLEIQPSTTTSTLDETILNEFTLSPNPARGTQAISIDLSFNTAFSGLLSLYNTSGQSLLVKPIKQQVKHTTKLDVSGLESGLYYLRLSNKEGVSTRKLVID